MLLCTNDDVRPGLKLTDFGLALAGERAERIDGGTPLFMAPEQFDADGRDLGPWTDLYALGCLAYWLATGAPPFVDESWRMLAARHVEEKPAPLAPSLDLPAGFSPWVLRLLEKNPAKRYRCAADADAALAALDPGRPAPPANRLPDGLDDAILAASVIAKDAKDVRPDNRTIVKVAAPTEILPPRTDLVVRVHSVAPEVSAPKPPSAAAITSTPRSTLSASDEADSFDDDTAHGKRTSSNSGTQPPPLDVGAARPPRSWRSGTPPIVDLRLVEAGLSLWGLRPVPLVRPRQRARSRCGTRCSRCTSAGSRASSSCEARRASARAASPSGRATARSRRALRSCGRRRSSRSPREATGSPAWSPTTPPSSRPATTSAPSNSKRRRGCRAGSTAPTSPRTSCARSPAGATACSRQAKSGRARWCDCSPRARASGR